MEKTFLQKEDYTEACCVRQKPDSITPVPVKRVLDKLDEYLGCNDYESAERHLLYWRTEAETTGDRRGLLTVLNEQIGLYRKLNRKTEGLAAVDAALALAEELDIGETAAMGTTLINAATACRAFGDAQKALPMYERAQKIYECILAPDDSRLGGLCNNMALTVLDLGDYRKAEKLFGKALSVMERVPNGEAEQAVTYCNLADLAAAELGMEAGEKKIETYLDQAQTLLDTPSLPHDGHYAFVCEKCAPVFRYYGFFAAGEKYEKLAREIRKRV